MKRKRDQVTEPMRNRLMANRDGRMYRDQWLDIVTDPLVTLLLLLAPALLVLVLLLVMLALLVVPVAFRARHYARAPVHFEVLYGDANPRPPWMFWRPQVFYTGDGQPVRFGRRLAPFMFVRPEQAYLVYYLRDTSGNVLLSLAPADHPDAERWQPSKFFESRFTRRTAR
jgi:hypothetical protein